MNPPFSGGELIFHNLDQQRKKHFIPFSTPQIKAKMKRSRDDLDNDYDSPSSAPQQESEDSSGAVKIVHLTQEEIASPTEVMRCSLPGHPELSFATYDEYEGHYNQSHLWKCLECRHNFPSEHYLGLHILENHDSMAQVRKERGEKIVSWQSFVEAVQILLHLANHPILKGAGKFLPFEHI